MSSRVVGRATYRRSEVSEAIPCGVGYRFGVELRVTATARDGAGVARAPDGRVVFVDGALAGETVVVELSHVDKRWSRASVVQVVDAAPDRVPVDCAHQIEGCGGCDLLHVAKSAQLRLKTSMVVDQLTRNGVDAPVPAFRSLEDDRGRTTVRAAIHNGRAGFRAKSSHDVVVPDNCDAIDPLAEEILIDGRFPHASEITIRVGSRTGERLVVVEGSTVDMSVPDDVRTITSAELADGRRAWIHEEVAGRVWRVSARSFFQNRPAGADALVEEVTEMADLLCPDGAMVDAYSGVGLFAGTVGLGRPVIAVERSRDSTADARVNLRDTGAKVMRAGVEKWRPSPASLVVADPAREGLGKPGVRSLSRCRPEVLILVSCSPSSFAKDSKLLEGEGFALDRWTVIDLFPRTSHVETVAAYLAV